MEDKLIQVKNLSLDEWLEVFFSPNANKLFPPSCCFPSEKIEKSYLAIIDKRPEKEVVNLIRKFVISTGALGKDRYTIEILNGLIKEDLKKAYNSSEYNRRLLRKDSPNWEGLTWIIDLLPYCASEAINVIEAYYIAHFWVLPDFRINGLLDAIKLIRARYLEKEHPREILLNLKPKEFEWLIEDLYSRIGYETILTKESYDGGIDIIAERKETGKKELLLIQCKRYTPSIGIKYVRNLLGVVTSKKGTKGVLITSSDFTSTSKKFEKENPSIELINWKELVRLLNKYCGANWSNYLSDIFIKKKKKKNKVLENKMYIP